MDFEKHLYGNIIVTDLLGARVRNLRAEAQAARRKEQELERLKRAFGILSGAGGMAPFVPPVEASVGYAKHVQQNVGFGPKASTVIHGCGQTSCVTSKKRAGSAEQGAPTHFNLDND